MTVGHILAALLTVLTIAAAAWVFLVIAQALALAALAIRNLVVRAFTRGRPSS